MSDTLYLQIDQNVEVDHPHVYLQDIAKLSCSNSKALNRLRVMPVINLEPAKPGRYVMAVMELVEEIQKKEPNLDITPIGEPNFIITYQAEPVHGMIWRWAKVALVCVATFFGAAFSIMTFNNDVDLGSLFSQVYTQVTGQESTGFGILEISYSVGVGLGGLFLVKKGGRMKITDDIRTRQGKMSEYEERVKNTIKETIARTRVASTNRTLPTIYHGEYSVEWR